MLRQVKDGDQTIFSFSPHQNQKANLPNLILLNSDNSKYLISSLDNSK